MESEACAPEWIAREEAIRERADREGNMWRKVYFGGGSHFRNWLEQFREVYGDGDIEVEEVDPAGLACYERDGERVFRIWAKVPE
ncbi:MAG: hypothetical protein R6U89_04705 [Dehalococcoidia bacterium]